MKTECIIMKIKRIITGGTFLMLFVSTVQAQEVVNDSISYQPAISESKTELVQTSNADSEQSVSKTDYAELQQRIWKRRKYLYIAYGNQKISSDFYEMKSDMAFALIYGRTYYLHKKPIAGRLKFGLDVNMDINFAKYPDMEPTAETSNLPSDVEPVDLGIMQLEAGLGIGPSITVNPVSHLKVALYFHVTPSYSMMLQNEEFYKHYATFFNAGLTVSYKVISLGIENRWCGKTSYDGVALSRIENIYDDNGVFHDPFESIGNKMKTNTFRVFIGFRW